MSYDPNKHVIGWDTSEYDALGLTEGVPSQYQEEEEESGYIDQIKLGASTAYDESAAGLQFLGSEIADYFGAEDTTRYLERRAQRNMELAKEKEKGLTTLGEVSRFATGLAPDIGLLALTRGQSLAPRIATVGAGSFGLSAGDMLAGQEDRGQERSLAKVAPHAAAAAATDIFLPTAVNKLLPTSSPLAKSAMEGSLSGMQGQGQFNLAVDDPFTTNLGMAGLMGAGMGAGMHKATDAFLGMNERMNVPLNKGGEDAASKVNGLANDIPMNSEAKQAFVEGKNMASAYDEAIINAATPEERANLSARKAMFDANDVFTPAIEMLDEFKSAGIPMHSAVFRTKLTNLENKGEESLGDALGMTEDDYINAERILSDARPSFLNRNKQQKEGNTREMFDRQIELKGREYMKDQITKIKSIPGTIESEINKIRLQGSGYDKQDLEYYLNAQNAAEKISNLTDAYISESKGLDLSKMMEQIAILDKNLSMTGLNEVIKSKHGISSVPNQLNKIQMADRALANLSPSWRQGTSNVGGEPNQTGSPVLPIGFTANLAQQQTMNVIKGVTAPRALRKEKERSVELAGRAIEGLQQRASERDTARMTEILGDSSLTTDQAGMGASRAAYEGLQGQGINTHGMDIPIGGYEATPSQNLAAMTQESYQPEGVKERIGTMTEAQREMTKLTGASRGRKSLDMLRASRLNKLVHSTADSKKVPVDLADEALQRIPEGIKNNATEPELKKALGQYIDEITNERKAKEQAQYQADSEQGAKKAVQFKENLQNAINKHRERLDKKYSRDNEQAKAREVTDKWKDLDKFIVDEGIDKAFAEHYLKKQGLEHKKTDFDPVKVRGGLYTAAWKELSDDVSGSKPKTTHTIEDASTVIRGEFGGVSERIDNLIDSIISRAGKTELKGISPAKLNNILNRLDKEVAQEKVELQDELDTLISQEQAAIDAENDFYDKWKNSTGDDIVNQAHYQAQYKQAKGNAKALKKQIAPLRTEMTEFERYESARDLVQKEMRTEEAAHQKELAEKQAQLEKLEQANKDLGEFGEQLKRIESTMKDYGADDEIIQDFKNRNFKATVKPINESVKTGQAISFTEKSLKARKKQADEAVTAAKAEMDEEVSKMNPAQVEAAVKQIVDSIGDTGAVVEDLRVMATLLDSVLAKRKEINSEEGKKFVAVGDVIRDALKYAANAKTEYPENPEFWLSIDDRDRLGKALVGREGSKEYGSYYSSLRAMIYGSDKARKLLTKAEIARRQEAGKS